MSYHDQLLPLSFRAELLAQVMPALRAGECCSLIGPSGVGKTNLARFLQRPDVQAHYWGAEPAWVVLIDTNGMVFGAQPDEFVVLELLIHQLIRAAEQRQLSAELIAACDRLHAGLVAQPSPLLAMRYLDRICGRLLAESDTRLIFVFDQFEDLWRRLEARLFLNLRYLRDEYKYRLAFLVMTRESLQRSRDDPSAVEAFWELFAAHRFGLGMYSAADAAELVARIARRRNLAVASELTERLIELSGGHPGLLRALFWRFQSSSTAESSTQDAQVAEECAKIWGDLSAAEQQLVRAVAAGQLAGHARDPLLAELQLKGLVVGTPPRLFAPVFGEYIAQQADGNSAGVVVAPELRQVWVDGKPLAGTLSRLEFDLLEYLARHAGRICRRDEILGALYGEQAFEANDERLDTLLRRLREALGESGKRHLVTHRGVGIRLTTGQIRT